MISPSSSKTLSEQQVVDLDEEVRDLELRLASLRNELAHNQRLTLLGTLASAVAHEYHNILTPVLSYAQLAMARPDDSELTHKALERAATGAEQAARISASLLGFSRDQDQHPSVDLAEIPDTVRGCLGSRPRRLGVEVAFDLPQIQAGISPLALQQVLVNLIVNAMKAMKQKGGRVTVTAEADADRVCIKVHDTGPGIPPQILDRLFEPFVTHSNTESPTESGTGLGLSICRELVEAADGQIWVDSAPGQGAAFFISLPIAEPAP